jgi:hypothetical protein
MTEELEAKLNELLGLKKHLDDAVREKQNAALASVLEQYRKEARSSTIRLWVGIVLGVVLVELGVIGIHSTGPGQYLLCGFGILGLYLPIAAKLGFTIKQSKLAVLYEIKQLELRMTELLKEKEARGA